MVKIAIAFCVALVCFALNSEDAEARRLFGHRFGSAAHCAGQDYCCASQPPAVTWSQTCAGEYAAVDCAGNIVGHERSVLRQTRRGVVLRTVVRAPVVVVRGAANVALAPVRRIRVAPSPTFSSCPSGHCPR
jgi:hypothetical protein